MPQLPRDIGERIASDRAKRHRIWAFLRSLLGLKPSAPRPRDRNPKGPDKDRV
jgi:hypothetical protein